MFSVLFVLFLTILQIFADYEFDDTARFVTNSVCLPEDYNNKQPPQGNATMVFVDFLIFGISSVKDKQKTITLELALQIYWIDERILVNNNTLGDTIDFDSYDDFWLPDNYFVPNLVEFRPLYFMKPLKRLVVWQDNYLLLEIQTRVTFFCRMSFEDFPMDVHSCDFSLMAMDNFPDVTYFSNYSWDPTNDTSFTDTAVYEINVIDLQPGIAAQWEIEEYNKTSHIGFTITLNRRTMPYILVYYLPAIAIVILSQMSFLISPKQLPGRVALLVTLFLVLTNIFMNQQLATPPSKEITSLGEFLLTCLFFVFAALLEFALVLKQKRSADLKQKLQANNARTIKVAPAETSDKQDSGPLDAIGEVLQLHYLEDSESFSSRIDIVASVIFALAFLVFNVVYWAKSLN